MLSPILLLLAPLLASAFKIQTFKDCNCEDPTGGQTIQEGLAPVQWRDYKLEPTQSCSVSFTAEPGEPGGYIAGLQIYADFPGGRQLDRLSDSYKCYRQSRDDGRWGPGSEVPVLRVGVTAVDYDMTTLPPPGMGRKRSGIARLD